MMRIPRMMRAALILAAALLVTPAAAQVPEVRSPWRLQCVWPRRGGAPASHDQGLGPSKDNRGCQSYPCSVGDLQAISNPVRLVV